MLLGQKASAKKIEIRIRFKARNSQTNVLPPKRRHKSNGLYLLTVIQLLDGEPYTNRINLLEPAETSVWFSLTGKMIDGLERHRAQLEISDSDNAHVVDSGLATCFLVGLLPMALEVFRGSRGDVAHRPTADGLGLLCAHRDRSAQPDRASICGDYRARPALFIPGASYRLRALQSAVCGSAFYSRNFIGRPTSD